MHSQILVDTSGDGIRPVSHTLTRKFGARLLPLLCAAALAGCASVPPPTEQMAVSRTAVDGATSAGGTEFAPLELRTAQDKLSAANQAMDRRNYAEAKQLASEAQVDAKLAELKARSAKAEKAVSTAREGIEVLRQEMNRSSRTNMQDSLQ